MKKRHIVLLVILGVLLAGMAAGIAAKNHIENNLNQLASIRVPETDLSKIEDGIYTGSYQVFPVSAKVAVTVENHQITAIDLIEHKNGQGAAAESIPESVLEKQSLNVDIVSGATYSSKVILLAIENALSNPEQI